MIDGSKEKDFIENWYIHNIPQAQRMSWSEGFGYRSNIFQKADYSFKQIIQRLEILRIIRGFYAAHN